MLPNITKGGEGTFQQHEIESLRQATAEKCRGEDNGGENYGGQECGGEE